MNAHKHTRHACTGQNTLRVHSPNITLSASHYMYEGIVEIYHNGEWGTICNTNWNYNNSLLVCQMAGFNSVVTGATYHGRGNGTVWLDNIQCTGSETTLFECTHGRWGVVGDDCLDHSRDVTVVCSKGN